jgi:hypothetical protein
MASKRKVKTFDDFKPAHVKAHIVPAKIKAGIVALTKNGWEYETDFLKSLGVSSIEGAKYRDGFLDFIVTVNGGKKRVYCGSKALAAKMTEALLS